MKKNDESMELKDLYDVNRIPLNKVVTRGSSVAEGEYYMVVHICILNDKNELLIQHRQPFKNGWSNMWDISAAGGVLAGETSSMAAHRETLEEIGLDIDFTNIRPKFTFNFEHGFDDYYIIRKNIDDIDKLKLQKEEVKEVKWATKEEVLSMVDEGIMVRYLFLDKIFEMEHTIGAFDHDPDDYVITKASMKNIKSIKNTFEVCQCFDKIEENKVNIIKNIESYISQGKAICVLNKKKVVGLMVINEDNSHKTVMIHPKFIDKNLEEKMIEFKKLI